MRAQQTAKDLMVQRAPNGVARIRTAEREAPEPTFRQDVLLGLGQKEKSLSSKYFYDARGSQLFDAICELEEYYVTRTELAIMRRYADEMAARLGARCQLIEFGSGSSSKTRILLDALPTLSAYVPVDISGEHLAQAAKSIEHDYPSLEVIPVCADYTRPFDVPRGKGPVERTAAYFPGSTIGNFTPSQAEHFLSRLSVLLGRGGILLLGVDLKKAPATLHAAYNDAKGVTAAFNKNLLARINRELGADFDLSLFEHYASYNPRDGRIEMRLVSMARQVVQIEATPVAFEEGEAIVTEYSYKYTLREIARLAAATGFEVDQVWTDPAGHFSVQSLRVTE